MLKKVFSAGVIASSINLPIAFVATWLTKAPPTFAPFTAAPILTGCFGGALLAALVFYCTPRNLFITIATAALFASYHLPYQIAYSTSLRFEGLTLPMQVTLGIMHTVVAITAICIFCREKGHET